MVVPGPRPGPPDPRDVEKQIAGILSEVPEDLAAEAEQLTRAHAVLHRALQERNQDRD